MECDNGGPPARLEGAFPNREEFGVTESLFGGVTILNSGSNGGGPARETLVHLLIFSKAFVGICRIVCAAELRDCGGGPALYMAKFGMNASKDAILYSVLLSPFQTIHTFTNWNTMIVSATVWPT